MIFTSVLNLNVQGVDGADINIFTEFSDDVDVHDVSVHTQQKKRGGVGVLECCTSGGSEGGSRGR